MHCRGACLVGGGGHAWKGGVHSRGACVGAVHGRVACGQGDINGMGTCMAGGVHARGVCVGVGMHGRGCAWQGGMHGRLCVCHRGCACQGAWVVGGVHGRGACMVGGRAIAAGGTHPAGMHSCPTLNHSYPHSPSSDSSLLSLLSSVVLCCRMSWASVRIRLGG